MVEEITIRVSGRIIERIVWIIVVLALLIALIWTNVSDIKESGDALADKYAAEDASNQDTAKTDETVKKETTPAKTETKTTTKTAETSTPSEDADPRIVDGRVEILLAARPITELKGTPDTRYMRAKVLSFEILNGLKDFKPKIYLYIYDDNDNKEDYKESIIYDDKTSEEGQVFSQNERISLSFTDINELKTVELELYDEEDNLLDTYSEQINFGEVAE